jgi:hypothetical protein
MAKLHARVWHLLLVGLLFTPCLHIAGTLVVSAQGEDDEVMGEGESVTMGGGGEEEEEEDMEVEDEEEDEPVKAPDVVSIVGCNNSHYNNYCCNVFRTCVYKSPSIWAFIERRSVCYRNIPLFELLKCIGVFFRSLFFPATFLCEISYSYCVCLCLLYDRTTLQSVTRKMTKGQWRKKKKWKKSLPPILIANQPSSSPTDTLKVRTS